MTGAKQIIISGKKKQKLKYHTRYHVSKNSIEYFILQGKQGLYFPLEYVSCFRMVLFCLVVVVCLFVGFSRQGFAEALEPVLDLATVDQVGFKLTEACLCLPSAS